MRQTFNHWAIGRWFLKNIFKSITIIWIAPVCLAQLRIFSYATGQLSIVLPPPRNPILKSQLELCFIEVVLILTGIYEVCYAPRKKKKSHSYARRMEKAWQKALQFVSIVTNVTVLHIVVHSRLLPLVNYCC